MTIFFLIANSDIFKFALPLNALCPRAQFRMPNCKNHSAQIVPRKPNTVMPNVPLLWFCLFSAVKWQLSYVTKYCQLSNELTFKFTTVGVGILVYLWSTINMSPWPNEKIINVSPKQGIRMNGCSHQSKSKKHRTKTKNYPFIHCLNSQLVFLRIIVIFLKCKLTLQWNHWMQRKPLTLLIMDTLR